MYNLSWTDLGRKVKPPATFKTNAYKKTDEGKISVPSSSKPWSTIKTGTKNQEKPKDTRKMTLPDAKTATETKEKSPGEAPSMQVKSLHFPPVGIFQLW